MSRSQVVLLGLSLLLMLLLYMGLPGPPEQTSRLWGDANVTVLAGLTRGNSPIFYREVLPLHQTHRWVLTPGCSRTRRRESPCMGSAHPTQGAQGLGGQWQEGRTASHSQTQNTHSPVCPQGGGGAAPRKGL